MRSADAAFAARAVEASGIDRDACLEAARAQGRSRADVLAECLALADGPGGLSVDEYMSYRLWNRELHLEAKRRFVGKRVQMFMHMACNDVTWLATAHDKLLFHLLMSASGFQVPRTVALISARRTHPAIPSLVTAADTAAWLRRSGACPCFVKPVSGMHSVGVRRLDSFDDGRVVEASGAARDVDDLAADLAADPADLLVQERLLPHRSLSRVLGDRLCSVRMMVLRGRNGPELHRAVLKIPSRGSIADNFWRAGNLIGAVAPDGRVLRLVRGTGVSAAIDPADVGFRAADLEIPEWDSLHRLALAASELFPGLATQAWDVALAERGPVFLELNAGGDLVLPQTAFGTGILDGRFERHLAEHGYEADRSAARGRHLEAWFHEA